MKNIEIELFIRKKKDVRLIDANLTLYHISSFGFVCK